MKKGRSKETRRANTPSFLMKNPLKHVYFYFYLVYVIRVQGILLSYVLCFLFLSTSFSILSNSLAQKGRNFCISSSRFSVEILHIFKRISLH